MENSKLCWTTSLWEKLENERLKGYRVFTRGIWYALTIVSCFGLLKPGKEVLFSPIRFGVTSFFAVMVLRCFFFVGYKIPTTPVMKNLRFVISFIILSVMFFVPFNYPRTDVFVTMFSLLAGGISIYQLYESMDIGHALILVFFAFVNGQLAIDLASQNRPFSYGFLAIFFFQYIIYVYNFEFLASVV